MALIDCPNCDYKHISDSSPKCPNCNFSVAEYFNQLYQSYPDHKNKLYRNTREEEEWNKLLPELSHKLLELENKFKIPNKPHKPKLFDIFFLNGHITMFSITLISLVLWISIFCFLENNSFVRYIFYVGLLIPVCVSIYAIGIHRSLIKKYEQDISFYNFATQHHPRQLKEEVNSLRDLYRIYAHNMVIYGRRTQENSSQINPINVFYSKAEELGYHSLTDLIKYDIMIESLVSDTEHYICCPECGKILNIHPEYCAFCQTVPKYLVKSKYPANFYTNAGEEWYKVPSYFKKDKRETGYPKYEIYLSSELAQSPDFNKSKWNTRIHEEQKIRINSKFPNLIN